MLYLGKLGDSIIQFEGATKTSLHPTLVFNLVGLYELKVCLYITPSLARFLSLSLSLYLSIYLSIYLSKSPSLSISLSSLSFSFSPFLSQSLYPHPSIHLYVCVFLSLDPLCLDLSRSVCLFRSISANVHTISRYLNVKTVSLYLNIQIVSHCLTKFSDCGEYSKEVSDIGHDTEQQ